MTRILPLLAAIALLAGVFAATSTAVPAPSDRSQAKRYAKAVVINKVKKGTGTRLRSSDIRMTCTRARGYYRCVFETTNGQCSGDLRVYPKRYGFKAKKVRIGCVSENPPTAG